MDVARDPIGWIIPDYICNAMACKDFKSYLQKVSDHGGDDDLYKDN